MTAYVKRIDIGQATCRRFQQYSLTPTIGRSTGASTIRTLDSALPDVGVQQQSAMRDFGFLWSQQAIIHTAPCLFVGHNEFPYSHKPPRPLSVCQSPSHKPPCVVSVCQRASHKPPEPLSVCQTPSHKPTDAVSVCQHASHKPTRTVSVCPIAANSPRKFSDRRFLRSKQDFPGPHIRFL